MWVLSLEQSVVKSVLWSLKMAPFFLMTETKISRLISIKYLDLMLGHFAKGASVQSQRCS